MLACFFKKEFSIDYEEESEDERKKLLESDFRKDYDQIPERVKPEKGKGKEKNREWIFQELHHKSLKTFFTICKNNLIK